MYKKVAIGIIVSIPILLLFGALFSSADASFQKLMRDIFDFHIQPTIFWRIFRTFLITLYLSSIFYVVIGGSHILLGKEKEGLNIDTVIIGTVLTLVNILFLVFLVVQLKTIGMADYARSGFFQLAWVIGLADAMLLLFYHTTIQPNAGRFLRFLKLFLILQVGVIAFFTLRRMYLFQDLGFSVLRLYVEWFIYFVLVVLFITAGSLLKRLSFQRLFSLSTVLGIVAMTVVASVNVDRIVAKENFDRFIQGKDLQMVYLEALSIDSADSIFSLWPDYGSRLNKDQQSRLGIIVDRFGTDTTGRNDWREWNFGVEEVSDTLRHL